MRIIIVLLIIAFLNTVQAEGIIESHSHKEIARLARSTVAAIEGVREKNRDITIEMLTDAAIFKGYISAYLDFAQEGESKETVRKCVTSKPTAVIAYNVALALLKQKINREVGAHTHVAFTVLAYCAISLMSE